MFPAPCRRLWRRVFTYPYKKMSTFDDSVTQHVDDSLDSVFTGDSAPPFDDDNNGFVFYDSQRFVSSETQHFTEVDSRNEEADDVFVSPPPIYGGYSNGTGVDDDGPILPPPMEMEPEEGFALMEWRRQNASQLAEKEKREKELLSKIIEEADQYKVEFYRKREVTCEHNKATNREKEKLFVANLEKFYAEVDKNYWKAIAELIPNEVPAIEKRGKKDHEKKPSIVIVQGPKPGKPTDLARMRQILLKLKHNAPPHLKLSPPPAQDTGKDSRTDAPPKITTMTTTPEVVVAA